MQQAVGAGLISAVTSLLAKTPSDWLSSDDGGTGSDNPLLIIKRIQETKYQAVAAAREAVYCGFRKEAVSQGLLETLVQ